MCFIAQVCKFAYIINKISLKSSFKSKLKTCTHYRMKNKSNHNKKKKKTIDEHGIAHVHGLDSKSWICWCFSFLVLKSTGLRKQWYAYFDSHFSFSWIVVQDIFSHTLKHLSKCTTAQELGQHQLVPSKVGQGRDVTVCWYEAVMIQMTRIKDLNFVPKLSLADF